MATSRRRGIIAVIVTCLVVILGVTIFLLYTGRTVSVRFETGNGPRINNIVLKVGDTPEQPEDPEHTDPGYYFAGWYIDENYEVEYDWDMPVEKNTTVFVKWEPRVYSVNILRRTNGGYYEVLHTIAGKYTSTVELPTEDTRNDNYPADAPNPDERELYKFKRTNYDFLGFSYEDDSTYEVDLLPGASYTMPNRATNIFAVFRGESNTFQFDSNSASGMVSDQKGYINEYFTIPSSEGLHYKYHTFVCWNTEPDGTGTDYYADSQIKVTSNETVTLYAQWERNKVNVLISANEGEGTIGENDTNLVDAGLLGGYPLGAITPPTREGYRLMSYNTQPDGSGVEYELNGVVPVEEEDINLYAQWQLIINVSYDYNGYAGDPVENLEPHAGIAGESFTIRSLPEGMERPNFDFLGWDTNPDANSPAYTPGNTFNITHEHNDDVVLYAIWQGVERKLIFNNNGGGGGNIEVNSFHGRKYVIDKTAKHSDVGYKFAGWNTKDNGTGVTYDVGSVFIIGDNLIDGASTLYAVWEPHKFNVNYYLQGGTCSFDIEETTCYAVTYSYKEAFTLIHSAGTIYRSGYRFMGWGLSSNSSTAEYFDVAGGPGWSMEMPARNLNLFAVWTKEYTITFNPNGGSGAIDPIENLIIGEEFTLPDSAAGYTGNIGFSRNNYDLLSWASAAEGGIEYAFGETVTFENANNTVIYAVWKGSTRHIYVYNNLDNTNWVVDIVGNYGERIPIEFDNPLNHTDPGYELAGFAQTPLGGKAYNYGDVIRAPEAVSISIYALWDKKDFQVEYNLNGGTFDGIESMVGYNELAEYESEITLPVGELKRDGYTFVGWYEDINGTGTKYDPGATFVIPSRATTFYAVWAKSYTLIYNSNGGINSGIIDPEPVTMGKGQVTSVIENPYVKENYEFVEWNTRQDGLGTAYAERAPFTFTADTTLYAMWRGVEVYMELVTGAATNMRVTPTPRYGDILDLASRTITPPENGYALSGWADSSDPDTILWTNTYPVDTTDRHELVAVWTPKVYKLLIKLNGGIYNNSYEDIKMDVPYSSEVNLATYAANLKQSGYKLSGFTKTQNGLIADYLTSGDGAILKMAASNTTIYAKWDKLAVVTFHSNYEGGPADDVREHTKDDFCVLPILSREHYDFLGWSQSETATTPNSGMSATDSGFTITIIRDYDYYAVWQGHARVLNLDPNGAEGSTGKVLDNVRYGDKIDLTQHTLSRINVGYEFAGWSTTSGDDNVNSQIVGDYTVGGASPTTTLYAVWLKRNFTIRLISVGKQVRSLYNKYDTYTDLTPYAQERTGYEFLGWSENEFASSATYTNQILVPNHDVTLYAIWKEIAVQVNFMNDSAMYPGVMFAGASTDSESFAIKGLYQLTITLPTNYLEPGNGMYYPVYKFTGWRLKQANGSLSETLYKAGESFQVFQKSAILFYAQWEINYISVMIDANGGVIDGTTNKIVSVKENDPFTLPTKEEVVRDGYRLLGFKPVNGDRLNPSTAASPVTITITSALVVDEVVKYTAQWIRQYRITFAHNVPRTEVEGGLLSGEMPDIYVDSGTNYTIPTSSYVRTNYVFQTWNLNSIGTGDERAVGSQHVIIADTTLYAVWLGEARTVILNYNGNLNASGESTEIPVNTNYGQILELSGYQKAHYSAGKTIGGWKFDKDAENFEYRYTGTYVVGELGDNPATGIITLYAHWINATFTVTFDANGGVFLDGTTQKVEDLTSTDTFVIKNTSEWYPNNPDATLPAYNFLGWAMRPNLHYTSTRSESLSTTADVPSETVIYTPNRTNDTKCHYFKVPDYAFTMYAIWEPREWQVQFVADDSNPEDIKYYGEPITAKYGQTITLKSGATKTDYLFENWAYSKNGEEVLYVEGGLLKIDFSNMDQEDKSDGEIVLIAKWKPQTVNIRIIGNDGYFKQGEATQKQIVSSVGWLFTFPNVKEADESMQLFRENYALIGFATEPDGSGNKWNPGTEYRIPSLAVLGGSELIVYALWVEAEAYIADADPSNNVYYATLADAVADTSSMDSATVGILKDCSITKRIIINTATTFIYEGDYKLTRNKSFSGTMFEISPSASLTVGDAEGHASAILTFNGNKQVSDAGPIFLVQGRLDLYSGVVVTNAVGVNGAAIHMSAASAQVSLQFCEVYGNTASGNGGAVFVEYGNLTIGEEAKITDNTAANGGAIYNNSKVTIGDEDTGASIIIENNSVKGVGNGNGGAIYNNGELKVLYVLLKGNSASNHGGAIYNNTGGMLESIQASYQENSAAVGGAIYNAATNNSNQLPNATITENKFGENTDSGNISNNNGGAIYNVGYMEIADTSFIGNYTRGQSASGGAITNAAPGLLKIGGTSGNKALFNQNQSTNGYGGALSVTGGEVVVGVIGEDDSVVVFDNNTTAKGEGMAIYITGGLLKLNKAKLENHEFTGTYAATGFGGVILVSGGQVDLVGAEISQNELNANGGAVCVTSGTLNVKGADINNNVAVNGGAIYAIDSATVNIESGSICKNTANPDDASSPSQGLGGAIYTASSGLTITGATIGKEDDENIAVNGGAIYTTKNIKLNGGTISFNTASENGGAIYTTATVEITKVRFECNYAELNGGAIYTSGNGTVAFVGTAMDAANSSALFIDNVADDGLGGAIYAVNVINIQDTIIFRKVLEDEINDVYLNNIDEANGNAILPVYLKQTGALSTSTRINITSENTEPGGKLAEMQDSNKAKSNLNRFMYNGNAGAVRTEDKYIVNGDYSAKIGAAFYQSLRLAYNAAAPGDTIVLHRDVDLYEDLRTDPTGSFDEDSPFAIDKSITLISGGDYTIRRGMMEGYMFSVVNGATLTIGSSSGTISFNGGVNEDDPDASEVYKSIFYVDSTSSIDMKEGITLTLNKADKGGAIHNDGTLTLRNGTITGNYAIADDGESKTGMGGAIYNAGTITLGNVSIISNESNAYGGGIYSAAGAVTLNNESEIIKQNKATIAGAGVYLAGGTLTITKGTISYNEVTGNALNDTNYAYGGGGVAITGGATLVMSNATSIIEYNEAENGGGVMLLNGTFTFTNGYLRQNIAISYGGGLYVAKINPAHTQTLTMSSTSNLVENTASNGGGIALMGVTTSFEGSTYLTAFKNTASNNGGGLYISGTSYDSDEDGTAEAYNSDIIFDSANIDIGKTGHSNTAANGGGVFILAGSKLHIKKADITYNYATVDGGGIFNNGTLIIGVGTYRYYTVPISWNTADGAGGGLYNAPNSRVDMYTAAFHGNHAGSDSTGGGGIFNAGTMNMYPYDGYHYIDIGSSDMSNKNVATNGGGVYNTGIWYVTSYQPDPENPTWYQGTVYIRRNTATDYGAGIYNSGTITMENGNINVTTNEQKNEAALIGGGGGVAIADGEIIGLSTGNYLGNARLYCSSNTASGYGGGMVMIGGKVRVVDSEFKNNATTGSGGGIAVISGQLIFEKTNGWLSSLTGNTATANGDALFLDTAVTFNQDISNLQDEIYLNNTRSYLIFGEKSVNAEGVITPYAPINYAAGKYLTLKSNNAGYMDGRKLAFFPVYDVYVDVESPNPEDPEGDPIVTQVPVKAYTAEQQYTKFKIIQPDGSSFGINYDTSGYVVLSAPVAKNVTMTENNYYSTLAAAAQAATPDHPYIQILTSHDVTTPVVVLNKPIYFCTNSAIILTRGKYLKGAMFNIINNTTTRRSVVFNWSGTKGDLTFGTYTLTLDGDKANSKVSHSQSSSLIYVTGDPGITAESSITANTTRYAEYSGTTSVYVNRRKAAKVNLLVRKMSFVNNTSFTTGGAITYYGYAGDLTSKSNYSSSPASTFEVTDCTFENNKQSCDYHKIMEGYTYHYSQYGGGAILAESGRLIIKGSTFKGNYAAGNGGAIFALGQAYYGGSVSSAEAFKVSETSFENNETLGCGGAINLISIYNNVSFGTETDNEASTNYIDFINNKAQYRGGAVNHLRWTPKSYYDYFYNQGRYSYSGLRTLNTTKTVFENYCINNGLNYTSSGKAGFLDPFEVKTNVDNQLYTGRLLIYRSAKFDGNSTTYSNASFDYYSHNATNVYGGGAIFSTNGLYTHSVNLTNNKTAANGGAVLSCNNTYMYGCNLDGNTAKYFGGGAAFKTIGYSQSPLWKKWEHLNDEDYKRTRKDSYDRERWQDMSYIAGNTVNNNKAETYDGGGFYFSSSNHRSYQSDAYMSKAYIASNTITNNFAYRHGGGIMLGGANYNSRGSSWDGSHYRVQSNTITGNTAQTGNGGGIYGAGGGCNQEVLVVWGCIITDNKAAYQGSGIYSYQGVAVVSSDIMENVITNYTTDSGGAIWSYWRIELYGSTRILDNEIQADTKGYRSGGAGLWAYYDRIFINNLYIKYGLKYSDITTTSKTIPSNSNPTPDWTAHNGDFTAEENAELLELGYYNWERLPDPSSGLSTSATQSWVPYKIADRIEDTDNTKYVTQDYDQRDMKSTSGVIYQNASTNTVLIQGNTCNGVGNGDGIFYYSSDGWMFHLSGNPILSDPIYLYNTNAGFVINSRLAYGEGRKINIEYKDGLEPPTTKPILFINKNIKFRAENLGIFAIEKPTGWSLTSSNLVSADDDICRFAFFKEQSISFRVYDNAYKYTKSSNSVDTSVLYTKAQITSTVDGDVNKVFDADPTTGAYIKGNVNLHHDLVDVNPGQSFEVIYSKIRPVKPGAIFKYFYTMNADGQIGKYYSITSAIPDSATLKGTDPAHSDDDGAFTLFIAWQNKLNTLTIRKYRDNKNSTYSYRTSDSQAVEEYTIMDGDKEIRDYTYNIYAGQTFEHILNDLRTTDNIKGFTDLDGNVAKKIYYEGYTYSHIALSIDMKVYAENDVYPYAGNTTLYLVYYKTVYNLTYTLPDDGTCEFLTDQTVQKCKYGSKVSLMSGSLVKKTGSKLVGWKDQDDKVYGLAAAYAIKKDLTLEPVWEAIPYTLRVYYNYPAGGSTFALYEVDANTPIVDALTSFSFDLVGYTLKGFSESPQLPNGAVDIDSTKMMPSEDKIIYAVWLSDTVTLIFYNEDGSEAFRRDQAFGVEFALPDMPVGCTKQYWTNRGSRLSYGPGASYVIESKNSAYLEFQAGGVG